MCYPNHYFPINRAALKLLDENLYTFRQVLNVNCSICISQKTFVEYFRRHIKRNTIPTVTEYTNIEIKVLVGEIKGTKSKVQTYSPVSIFDIQFSKPDMTKFNVDKEQNLMIYIIDGQLQFSDLDKIANKGDMVYFDQLSDEIQLTSISEKGSYLVLAGKPLQEPVARYGPFVTNTEGEIKQAMMDYQDGKMGSLT